MTSFVRTFCAFVLAVASGIAVGYDLPRILDGSGEVAMAPARPAPLDVVVRRPSALLEDRESAVLMSDTPWRPSWTMRSEQSPFSGRTNVYLSTASNGPLRCGPRRRATLMLRCQEDATTAYIAHDCDTPTLDGDGWDVEFVLDDGPLETLQLLSDDRGEALGFWTYREARPFIERLMRARQLHLRFADLRGRQNEMSFDIAGLEDEIGTLRQACGWSAIPPWMRRDSAGNGLADSVEYLNASNPQKDVRDPG